MARPRYETEKDRRNALRVGLLLQKQGLFTDVGLAKEMMPFNLIATISYDSDLAIKVKCVEYSMRQLMRMGGVFFSKDKWFKCQSICEQGNFKFWFVTKTTDGVWLYRASPLYEHDGIRMGGRTDRGDPADWEEVVLLGRKRFEQVA